MCTHTHIPTDMYWQPLTHPKPYAGFIKEAQHSLQGEAPAPVYTCARTTLPFTPHLSAGSDLAGPKTRPYLK